MVQLNLLPWRSALPLPHLRSVIIICSMVIIASGIVYALISHPLRQAMNHNNQLRQSIQNDVPIIEEIESIRGQQQIIRNQLNHWFHLPHYRYPHIVHDVLTELPPSVQLTQFTYQTQQWRLMGVTTDYPQLLIWLNQIEQLAWMQSVTTQSQASDTHWHFTITLMEA